MKAPSSSLTFYDFFGPKEPKNQAKPQKISTLGEHKAEPLENDLTFKSLRLLRLPEIACLAEATSGADRVCLVWLIQRFWDGGKAGVGAGLQWFLDVLG